MRKKALTSGGRIIPAVAGLVLPFATAATAQAADCSSLTNPVYIAGSSAVKVFLAGVAAELAGDSTPITVVYQGQGSCTGVGYMSTVPTGVITGTGTVWDTAGNASDCTLDLAGNNVDIGVSDVYYETCTKDAKPAAVVDTHGPVQSMTFAVPTQSSQQSISAEAGYLLVGFGAAGAVGPWTDESLLEVRSASSGTQGMIATALGVPAASWKGTSNKTSGDVLNGLVTAATGGNADKAIGILGADYVDANRDQLRELAYQHYGQSCGYLPDSTATSFDKMNVRDGHYMIWGPLHMLAVSDGSGGFKDGGGGGTSTAIKTVLDYLSGAVAPTTFSLVEVEAKHGVVPACAMQVNRDSEVGPMYSQVPTHICGCAYTTFANGTAPASCKACSSDADCSGSTPSCQYGYCEVQ